MTKIELSDVLQDAIRRKTIRASLEQWKVINDLIHCRTPHMDGHTVRCNDCGSEQQHYNSCRNRHCPKCQVSETAEWLEKRATELLNAPYFHLVFTIPHELNSIVLNNKRVVLDILFKASAHALKAVAKRTLGGEVGFFSILHTWGGKLEFHPHIHCVVPGIVVTPTGEAIRTGKKFLVSKRALQIVFRAVFLCFLRKAYDDGKRELHNGGEAQSFNALIKHSATIDWIVDARKPFSHPEVVLKYLARYTHRVAITNSRIKALENGVVRFLYRDKKKHNQLKSCTMESSEFVRRFLLHVLPRQFVRVRHYGFMATGLRTKGLQALRAKFGELPHTAKNAYTPCCAACGSIAITRVREFISIRRRKESLNTVAKSRYDSPIARRGPLPAASCSTSG